MFFSATVCQKIVLKKIWISQFLPSAQPDNDTWLWDKSFSVNATNQVYLSSAFVWRKILNRGDSKVEAICSTDLRKRSDLYLCCLLINMLCMLDICAAMRTMKNCNNARQAVMWQLLAAAATESRIQILKLDQILFYLTQKFKQDPAEDTCLNFQSIQLLESRTLTA